MSVSGVLHRCRPGVVRARTLSGHRAQPRAGMAGSAARQCAIQEHGL